MAEIIGTTAAPEISFNHNEITTTAVTGTGDIALRPGDSHKVAVGQPFKDVTFKCNGLELNEVHYEVTVGAEFDANETLAMDGPAAGLISVTGKVKGQVTTAQWSQEPSR